MEAGQLEEGLRQPGQHHADGQREDLLFQSPAHSRREQQHAGNHYGVEDG